MYVNASSETPCHATLHPTMLYQPMIYQPDMQQLSTADEAHKSCLHVVTSMAFRSTQCCQMRNAESVINYASFIWCKRPHVVHLRESCQVKSCLRFPVMPCKPCLVESCSDSVKNAVSFMKASLRSTLHSLRPSHRDLVFLRWLFLLSLLINVPSSPTSLSSSFLSCFLSSAFAARAPLFSS